MEQELMQEEAAVFVDCGVCGYCDDYELQAIQAEEAYCENCGNEIE